MAASLHTDIRGYTEKDKKICEPNDHRSKCLLGTFASCNISIILVIQSEVEQRPNRRRANPNRSWPGKLVAADPQLSGSLRFPRQEMTTSIYFCLSGITREKPVSILFIFSDHLTALSCIFSEHYRVLYCRGRSCFCSVGRTPHYRGSY